MTQTSHLNRVLFLTGFALSLSLGLTGDQILRNVYDSSNTALRVNVVVGGGGGGGGSGDITDVWGCSTGDCSALTAASGDSLNASSADTSKPVVRTASDPGTCNAGEVIENTTDGVYKLCFAGNVWRPFVIVSGTVTDGAVLIFSGATGTAIASACTVDGSGIMTCGTSGPAAFVGPDGTCDTTITASGQGGFCQDTTNDGVYCKDAAACSKLAYVESNRLTSANVATMLSDETGSGLVVLGTSPTLTTPVVSGKVNMDGGAVDDDDCTSEQGRFWFDDTDNQFEFCNAASGAPTVLSGSGAPTDATYITQTANGTLSAEQALSSLSTGIMRVATTTGVITSLTDSSGIAANISDETGSGALVFGTSPTIATPKITSKFDLNDVAVDDDDCTGEQGLCWFDTTDNQFECCHANSGAPVALGSGAGSGDITDVGPGYSTGAAFTDGLASTGTTMFVWEGTSVDTNELSILSPTADPGSDINLTLPSATSTICGSGIDCAFTVGQSFPDGSQSSPALRGSDSDTGLYWGTSGQALRVTVNNADRFYFLTNDFRGRSDMSIIWSNNTNPANGDTSLARAAAGVVGLGTGSGTTNNTADLGNSSNRIRNIVAGTSIQAHNGTNAAGWYPPVLSTTPTAPVTCAAAAAGSMVYVDDTDDSAKAEVCICLATDSTPTYDWVAVGTVNNSGGAAPTACDLI